MLTPMWIQVKERENMSDNEDGDKSFQELLSHSVFPHNVSLLLPPESCIPLKESHHIIHRTFILWVLSSVSDFVCQAEIIQPFLSLHPSIQNDQSMSTNIGDIGSVHGERVGGALTFEDGWSLAKAFHIHGWIFSTHGGQGQFLQSARHSKVKEMWPVDEGSVRDRHAWGLMVFRWEAASCWWVTVWAWRFRTCPWKGVAIRYPHLRGWYTYAPYAEEAHINCRTFSVLVIMPSCLSECLACLNEECRLTGLWPLRKFSSAQNDLVARINCQIKLHSVCQQYW